MLEVFEKAVLTGLGVVSLSQKKAEEFVAELKEKYKVSEEEGKTFLDKLQNMAKEGKERIAEMADIEVKKSMDRLGLVSREEFDLLMKRVEDLENRLQEPVKSDPC